MNETPDPQRIAELAAEMEAHGTARDAPVRAVMALLGDRWTTLILLVLEAGEWRHAELKRVLRRAAWNDADLVVRGAHIIYTINGHVMTDLIDDSLPRLIVMVPTMQLQPFKDT